VLLAIKLFIIATCLTLLRILFVSIGDYKEDLTTWLASEYNISLSVEDISAGVDFSGLILTLDNIELANSADLPFQLKFDYLFLHLDFWNSITQRNLSFRRISLQGVDLTVKSDVSSDIESERSLLTIDSLQHIFLEQLNQFSVKDSRIHFISQLGRSKTIFIDKLHWLNTEGMHQGVGSASLPNSLGDNSLAFVVKLVGERGNQQNPLKGALYIDADNINISDYLIDSVNSDVQILDAVLDFQAWAEFSLTRLNQVQIALKNSQFAWSQSNNLHNWQLNSGLLQFSNSEQGWLFDSYDLDIEQNNKKLKGLSVSGHGSQEFASFYFNALNLKDLLPFYFLNPELTKKNIDLLQAFDLNADIKQLGISKNKAHKLQFSAQLSALKNRPSGAVPGLTHANIVLSGNRSEGKIQISLPKQKIYFDGQFSRAMPIELGSLTLQWLKTQTGFKLFSDQAVLKTAELDTITDFSLLFPDKQAENQSPFLSLYSYASLNDASKARYYFPIKAMGNSVFDYLEPTLQAGTVMGAKILWYGALNHYPYQDLDGIFQAWVPLREAQYDFYGAWPGLTSLDLNLLFENDGLTMEATQASLGDVQVQQLNAQIDHLTHNGVLTINANISDDAQKISNYLQRSPLKESVGKALSVIRVENKLSGKLQLTIPFDRDQQQTQANGEVSLANNNINIKLADELILPLSNARGVFSFSNGNLSAKNIRARLFDQDIQFAFATSEGKKLYRAKVEMAGSWQFEALNRSFPLLAPLQLSGLLNWTGEVDFKHRDTDGYQYSVALNSATQGVKSTLPAPFNKNALQSWPSDIIVSGDKLSSKFSLNIKDKLNFIGELDHQGDELALPYFTLNIGADTLTDVDNKKHLINVNLAQLNINAWYQQWTVLNAQEKKSQQWALPVFELDQIFVDIKHATLFEQPLNALKVNAVNDRQKWSADIYSDNLQAAAEYRFGVPVRLDFDIKKLNFKSIDLSTFNDHALPVSNNQISASDNLLAEYPEVFAKCASCIYGDADFSPAAVHLYPSKSSLNIDYINIGTEDEFTHISGVWDQRKTNMIIDLRADENNNLVKRLGYVSPVIYQKAEASGNFNWIGAPWQFNYDSLNGAFSAQLTDGSITEVSDKGARLLSLFSLDGIRRSLNLEFNNVFAKGLNFDDLTLSAKITDGIVKNDDFYLDGSAGKIIGKGLIDLPNKNTNYQFSYSPAVTSSLPVLTAFAINPLTGAAVLLMSKILEPVVETIIRVDFSIKGALNNSEIKLINRQKGQVKLQNSEVLDEINKQQLNPDYGDSFGK
jgi:uncharacterized protein (TIGR02099 family)